MPKRERKTFGRRKKGGKYSSPGSSTSPSLPPGCSWAEAVAVLIPARGDTLLFFLLLPAAKACLQNLHWSLVFVNQRWLTAPNLCIPNCPLHPSPISLSHLLNWWDASNALQSMGEFLIFPCVGHILRSEDSVFFSCRWLRRQWPRPLSSPPLSLPKQPARYHSGASSIPKHRQNLTALLILVLKTLSSRGYRVTDLKSCLTKSNSKLSNVFKLEQNFFHMFLRPSCSYWIWWVTYPGCDRQPILEAILKPILEVL